MGLTEICTSLTSKLNLGLKNRKTRKTNTSTKISNPAVTHAPPPDQSTQEESPAQPPPQQPINAYILRLPLELLAHIASHLPTHGTQLENSPSTTAPRSRDLSNLSLVCKGWRMITAERIFEALTVTNKAQAGEDWLLVLESFPNQNWIRSLSLDQPDSCSPIWPERPLASVLELLGCSLQSLSLKGFTAVLLLEPRLRDVAPHMRELRKLILDAPRQSLNGRFLFPFLKGLPILEILEVRVRAVNSTQGGSKFQGTPGPPLRELKVVLSLAGLKGVEELTCAFSGTLRTLRLEVHRLHSLVPVLTPVQEVLETLEVYSVARESDVGHFRLHMPRLRRVNIAVHSSLPIPSALLSSPASLYIHFYDPPDVSTLKKFESLPNLRWVSIRPRTMYRDVWDLDRESEEVARSREVSVELVHKWCEKRGVMWEEGAGCWPTARVD